MSNIKRILFIDDECESFKGDFETIFAQTGIEIVYCKTKDEGVNALNDNCHYDLVLLDWFLEEPDSSILSIAFLAQLKRKLFIPVFIWTQQYENYEQELLRGAIPYPKDLIRGISKEEFESTQLQAKVTELYRNCKVAHLSKIYRETLHQKLEEVFFEFSEVSGVNLIKIIKSVVGETNNTDWGNDLILNFIHRHLISDREFIQNIISLLVDSSEISSQIDERVKEEIINKIMYYKHVPNRVRCGDILSIKDSNNVSKLAIIISPDCDLANGNTRHIELVELRKLEDSEMNLSNSNKEKIKKFNHPSFYFFPSLKPNENHQDFVAILKSKIILTEKVDNNSSNYPKPSKQLGYDDYYAIGETLAEIEFICRIDEPYKSDFLNHLHSHDIRVGIPDIKKLWQS